MMNIGSGGKQSPYVMVQFSDGAHLFLLPAGATLLELADKVDELTAMHDCAPLAIHVEFDTSGSRPALETHPQRAHH